MYRLLIFSLAWGCAVSLAPQVSAETKEKKVPAALNFTMKTLGGKEISLDQYLGNVVLIVNVASECGLTPQYEQLQALHEKYAGKGLAIVGVPCNQFGKQEPGSASEIRQFCTENYGVTFDLLEKVEVNGDGACQLYRYLTGLKTKPKGPGDITWNFEKFVIDRGGNVVGRFQPRTTPDAPELVELIESKLAEK